MFNNLFFLIFIFLTAVNCVPVSGSNSGGGSSNTEEEGGDGNNSGGNNEALIAQYDQKFDNYLAGFHAPSNPPAWALAIENYTTGDGTVVQGRYKLTDKNQDYIDSILNELLKAKVNENLIIEDMSSKPGNKVLILKNTEATENLEKSVFKTGPAMKNRITQIVNAHTIIENYKTTSLYAPKFAAPYGDVYLLEELITLNSSHEYQEELYTTLFEKAQDDPALKIKVTKLIEDITTIACAVKINDIKYDNFPLSPFGKVIILDPELDGGDIMRLLNAQTSEFYIPGDYIEAVKSAAAKTGAGFCDNIINADETLLNEAKQKGDERFTFIKGFKHFKAKKGDMTGKDPFSAQDIKKAQALFTNPKDKYFAQTVLETLNKFKSDSGVVSFDEISAALSFGTAEQVIKDKYKELGITFANYFQPINGSPAPVIQVLSKLEKGGFIYKLVSKMQEINNLGNIDIIYY